MSASRPSHRQPRAWAELGPLIRQERDSGPAVHDLREDIDQRMHFPSLPFIYALENPINAEPGTLLIFQPFNTSNRVAGHEFKHTHTHACTQNRHSYLLFLPCHLQGLRTWGVPTDSAAKRRTESWSEYVTQLASLISCFFSSASGNYIFIHMPFLLILACPQGWFTQITLMWANSVNNFALLFHWFKVKLILYSPTFTFLAEPC